MKRPILLTLLTLALAVPTLAVERHQSFISYDEGGTVVRSGEDGREVEARRNLPIYPDDEIVTARRGRAEVRLSDGNIIGIDGATALRFRSILDSYEGNAEETVAELRYGKVAVYRTDLGHEQVRLDTQNASYVADYEAVYSVETDSDGRDYVKVFEGSVEVRTPSRTTKLRSGEAANVDGRGVSDLAAGQRYSTDEFERWFLGRAERFEERSSRYVDRRTLYWADDLDDYGNWVSVSGIGWAWRPTVTVGWRPYYRGYWYRSRYGCLTWVSYDPWGWGTYHYGRWAYDPFHGWIWAPGYGYSPAWVYWWYGPSYVGWAPSGWWDCYRPYYDWAYRPHRGRGIDFGFGFYGRVRVSEMDLRPWTFVDSVGLISTRVDRAALTADAVKQRLGRSGGYATISGGTTRFTNEDLRDPAESIRRRSLEGPEGRLTGRETGAPTTDLTPFFRRDSDVSGVIRDRLVRSGGSTSAGSSGTRGGSPSSIGRADPSPSTGGSGAKTGGSGAKTGGTIERRGGSSDPAGKIDRGGTGRGASGGSSSSGGTTSSGGSGTSRRGSGSSSSWRGGSGGSSDSSTRIDVIDRGRTGVESKDAGDRPRAGIGERDRSSSGTDSGSPRRDSWRGTSGSDEPSPRRDSDETTSRGSSDVPRRVIDRIGGARIVPRDSSSDGRSRDTSARDSGRSGSSDRPRSVDRSGSSSSGGSRSSSGSSTRSSGSGSGSSSSGKSSSGSGSGGNRGSGGKIGKNQ